MYYIDALKHPEIQKIVRNFSGVVKPGMKAPVIIKKENYQVKQMTWGFKYNDGYIYNARSETVLEKSFFQSVYTLRCLIPVTGFYEWDKRDERYSYELDKPFYLAGFYQNNQFIIITTKANQHVRRIHHRMPLVLQGDDIQCWLSDDFEKVLSLKDIQFKLAKDVESTW